MSKGTRVRMAINGKSSTVVETHGAGISRAVVKYDEDEKTNTVYYVLKVFLDVIE